MQSQGLCRPSQGKRESPDIWANVKVEVSEDNTLLRQNSNLNLSEIHEPERCLVNAERKCPDCGPAVQRSLWDLRFGLGMHHCEMHWFDRSHGKMTIMSILSFLGFMI